MAITNLKLKTAMSLLCILGTFVPFVLLIFGALVKPMEKPILNGTAPDSNVTAPTTAPDNTTTTTEELDERCYRNDKKCKEGVVIPTWKPPLNPDNNLGQKVLRAVVYFLVMFFFFLGISVIADRFMAAIETITSQEKKVKVKMKNGEVNVTKVRIWNETVSNLTLMALGSSAPEILLAIIEVFGNKFDSGELGPGTIVGSAAFNLFVIIGICVYVIPDGETRRQKHLSVFFCTASWSIFAYIWLYLIIAVISPGRIQVWEAILTLCFFPMLVLNAYLLDTQVILKKFLKHRYRPDRSFGNASTLIATSDDHSDLPLKPLPATVIIDAASPVSTSPGGAFGSPATRTAPTTMMTTAIASPCAVVDVDRFDSLEVGAFDNSCYASSTAPASPANFASSPLHPEFVASSPNGDGKDGLPADADPDVEAPTPNAMHVLSPASTTTTTTATRSYSSSQSNVSSHPLTLAVTSKNEISPPLQSRRQTDFSTNNAEEQQRKQLQQQQLSQQAVVGDENSSNNNSLNNSPSCRRHRENGHVNSSPNLQEQQQPSAATSPTQPPPSPPVVTIDVNSVFSPPPPLAAITAESGIHLNQFQFTKARMSVVESCGEVEIEVVRKCLAPLPLGVKVRLAYRSAEGTAKFEKHFAKVSGYLVFEGDERTQSLRVGIFDECCYDKDLFFIVILENPTLVTDFQCNGFNNGGCNGNGGLGATNHYPLPLPPPLHHHHPPPPVGTTSNGVDSDQLPSVTISSGSPPDRLSGSPLAPDRLSGSPLAPDLVVPESGFAHVLDSLTPSLGETYRLNIRIRESKEYKSTVDKLLKRTNRMISTNTSSWRQQFVDAFKVLDDEDEDDEDDEGEGADRPPPREPTSFEYFVHFLSFFWKLLFATVPPTDLGNGWPCFCVSIFWVGVLTAVVGDVASHVGCTIGMKDTVTAISFVALGTSVPDTFASKIAAIQDEHADNSIGNVTGSNAVNVFLGVGIAWSIAAIYHEYWNTEFIVKTGSLGFALTVFCICAFIAVGILVARRSPKIANGELGGPFHIKLLTTAFFIGMWLVYILLNGLESYCYIPFPRAT